MDVGVRDLKQHLSEHLRRVADGEAIRVTDRGVPVAVILPIGPADPLEAGIEAGWIRPPRLEGRIGGAPRASTPHRISTVLDDDRDE